MRIRFERLRLGGASGRLAQNSADSIAAEGSASDEPVSVWVRPCAAAIRPSICWFLSLRPSIKSYCIFSKSAWTVAVFFGGVARPGGPASLADGDGMVVAGAFARASGASGAGRAVSHGGSSTCSILSVLAFLKIFSFSATQALRVSAISSGALRMNDSLARRGPRVAHQPYWLPPCQRQASRRLQVSPAPCSFNSRRSRLARGTSRA